MQDSNVNWERVERFLVSAVIAQGLRPSRYRPALLTSVKKRLPRAQMRIS